MPALRVQVSGTGGGHGGEVFSCVHTADDAFVLSAGWDGHLRLWQTSTGEPVTSLEASTKPLPCCALAPDGRAWLSGSMDGVLSCWDAVSHQLRMNFIAHIRPISAIQYSPDGQLLATASWDKKLVIRKVGSERDGLMLSGHHDIVSGCRFSHDGKRLLSWSHDGSVRLWDTQSGRDLAVLSGHSDRVTAASLTADGHCAVSGGRDGALKLWDLGSRSEVCSAQMNGEVRGCFCLLDGESVIAVAANGQVVLSSLPELEVQAELSTGIKVMSGDLARSGTQLAVGSENGLVHIVAIAGVENAPILVTPSQTQRPKSGMIGRILGKQKLEKAYQYTCPACRHTTEVSRLPSQAVRCAGCKRPLRLNKESQLLQTP